MNFLCHAIPYLDQPLLAVSTGVPDWLSVVDRRIRARGKLARPFLASEDAELRAVAGGVIRHIEDDRWFHGSRAFAELNLRFAVDLRDLLPGDEGFRPTFVGHILIEMLLDSLWLRDDPSTGRRYYDCFATLGTDVIQRCVNQITGKPTDQLSRVIERFVESKFLYDYLDDEGMLFRLNQVMNRVRLPRLPETVAGWLPLARNLVESQRRQLLSPPDAAGASLENTTFLENPKFPEFPAT